MGCGPGGRDPPLQNLVQLMVIANLTIVDDFHAFSNHPAIPIKRWMHAVVEPTDTSMDEVAEEDEPEPAAADDADPTAKVDEDLVNRYVEVIMNECPWALDILYLDEEEISCITEASTH